MFVYLVGVCVGNNVRDVIIAHVISADTQYRYTEIQIYRHGNGKVILGPAGRARSVRLAGKNKQLKK